jgi:glucans biosynthesis protein
MFVSGAAAMAVAAALKPESAAAYLTYGPPVKFSWDEVVSWANDMAREPFEPKRPSDPEIIQQIDFDAYQQIKYRPDQAIWPAKDSYPVELFHVGKYFMEPVRIFVVNEGLSREVEYTPELFTYGHADFAKALPPDTGFAGFRVMAGPNEPDWIAFLGASYFRATGETRQYGMSTRGLAVDIGLPRDEEFPRFTNFWLEPTGTPEGILIYALLESPSVTGAYKIKATHSRGALTEVECVINARQDVERLGVAPLTSMFWYGKNNRQHGGRDWRPEIHDTDGLSIWTGSDERIWRPLNNPPVTKVSAFVDKNPKGFGLLQRERDFRAYEDDGVFYNRRPSVWVEPLGEWGEGSIQLLEIPADDETKDNIGVYWAPKEPFTTGKRLELHYRIYWRNDSPFPHPNGRVKATRLGSGGIPGGKVRQGVTKYVIDFEGGVLGQLTNDDGVKLKVAASKGQIDAIAAYRVVDEPYWRAIFDYTPDGNEVGDLRAYLDQNGKALTETWIYQHVQS